MPSAVFALAFVLLGWVAGHSISYTLVGFGPHDQHEHRMHDYLDVLELAGGVGLVLALALALRAFFRYGTFGEWLHRGGAVGTRRQVALATVLPATVFVAVEYFERLAAGTGESPSAKLLVVGVLIQLAVGLLCLALVRLTFRVAEQVIRSIALNFSIRPNRRVTGLYFEGVLFVRLLCPMAGSAAGRAPPFPIVSR